jgi:hypothetical protein
MLAYTLLIHDVEFKEWAMEIKLRVQRRIAEISSSLEKKASAALATCCL